MKTIFVIMLLMMCRFTGTQQKPITEKIGKITYDAGGGYPGGAEIITITKDSIFYTNYGIRHKQRKERIKNSVIIWNNIVNSFNLADFDKIRSCEGSRELDGIDYRISIETDTKKERLLIDGFKDKDNYVKISGLVVALHKQLHRFNHKSVIDR
jgi:hypothetical protein